MPIRKQISFAGGECSPTMYSRIDTVKYATGARLMRNAIIEVTGAVSGRVGTKKIDVERFPDKKVRYLEFVFNNEQTYVITLGHLYMEFVRDGARVLEASKAITAIDDTFPHDVTCTGHGYVDNDDIWIEGLVGAEVLNNRRFRVDVQDANTFRLKTMDAVDVDLTDIPHNAYTSGGTSERVYKLVSPYSEGEIYDVRFVQSGDVVILTHPSWEPRSLSRTAHTAWTLTGVDFSPIAGPRSVAATVGAVGSNTYRYKVTAIRADNGKETRPGTQVPFTVTNITNADPAVVTTSAAHGYASGDTVLLDNIPSMPELDQREFTIEYISPTTFSLVNEDSTSYPAFSAGAFDSVARTSIVLPSCAIPTEAAPVNLTWSALRDRVSGAVATIPAAGYNVYKEQGGVFGFIGFSTFLTFADKGFQVFTDDNFPKFDDKFIQLGDFPRCCAFTQERLMLGGSDNDRTTIFGSKLANIYDFTERDTPVPDDALEVVLGGTKMHEVRHMIERGKFIVFTGGGGWVINGDQDGNIRPGGFNAKQHTYDGIGEVPPLIVDGTVLYVDDSGKCIRDFFFDISQDGYDGRDLTVFARHMFDGEQIKAMAYQKRPDSILWVLREDGTLLGCTYNREHRILGWYKQDFSGSVKALVAIPDSESAEAETAVYIAVERKTIYETTGTPITETNIVCEKLASRTWGEAEFLGEQLQDTLTLQDGAQAIHMDSTVSYNGWSDGSVSLTLETGDFNEEDTLDVTAGAAYFTAAAVGDAIHVRYSTRDADDRKRANILRLEIVGYTSSTIVTVRPDRTVPTWLQGVALTTQWGRAKKTVSGLWHLNGLPVSVFADGQVAANPSRVNEATAAAALAEYTVPEYGVVTLESNAVVIHVGLPVTFDLVMHDMDTLQFETMMDKSKNIMRVYLSLQNSRGGHVGVELPERDGQINQPTELGDVPIGSAIGTMQPIITRDAENYDEPNDLATGVVFVDIESEHTSSGRISVRQIDPLPITILAIGRHGDIPMR